MDPSTTGISAASFSDQQEDLRFAIPFEGSSPVQAWGSIGANQRFYFRWRGKNASLTVGPPAAVQPRTAAEVWAAMTGTTAEEARAEVGETPLRAGEVYPEGRCVAEETSVGDNLDDAAEVFRSLLALYEGAEQAN